MKEAKFNSEIREITVQFGLLLAAVTLSFAAFCAFMTYAPLSGGAFLVVAVAAFVYSFRRLGRLPTKNWGTEE